MEPPEPFHELAGQWCIELPGARVAFTTRRGGHSSGPYESLNLGFLTNDDPELVRSNRATAERSVGAPQLRFTRQVHGADVRVVRASDPVPEPPALPHADGQATADPGVALAALTADCLPIAIAGDGVVAVVHAGWRGLASGVVGAGVDAVRSLGARGPLAAAIGPGAGACCYRVGPDVHQAFAGIPDAHRGEVVDLPAVARRELTLAGVESVADIGICTICADPALLFSHRRDQGVTGRQAGIAWLS